MLRLTLTYKQTNKGIMFSSTVRKKKTEEVEGVKIVASDKCLQLKQLVPFRRCSENRQESW